MAVSIKNFTRQPLPRLPFDEASHMALPGWELSLAFAGEIRARALNAAFRGKAYVPNVLSYAAGRRSGEVIICLAQARREARRYGMSERTFILYLFIHGLLHLKGLPHGATMERRERALVARFAPALARSTLPTAHEKTHRNRHRHRHLPGEARRGRRDR